MTENTDEEFALKLVGDGVSIEKKVTRDVAMAIVAAVLGGAAPPLSGQPAASSRTKPHISPREFLTESRASSHAEQITALGHYLSDIESKESFSRDDIKDCFRRAHAAIPKNLPRDVGTAIKAGWIHEAPGNAGHYYVTNTGMQLVESKFGRVQ